MAINATICPYACMEMAEHKFYEQGVINIHDRRTIRPAFFRAPVSVLTWTAQLSTKSNGHPLPVTACARGGLAGAVTECRKEEGRALVARQSQTFRREKRGNGDGQSGTA